MKKLFILFFFPFLCFGDSFNDPTTGLSFEIPSGFTLNEEECGVDETEGSWWYVFNRGEDEVLSLDIDQYDHLKSLPEHFHKSMTENEDELERVVYAGMEFKNVEVNDRQFTMCKLRILADFDKFIVPFVVCDYLFVDEHFGFTFSLMTQDEECEEMLLSLLKSIHFEK
ncbi:MAG: hypothetical protein JSS30_03270 [Verrucomicrobia bacterium]|nr:hypothetical protein [Verrucomicrobiota bacterium]